MHMVESLSSWAVAGLQKLKFTGTLVQIQSSVRGCSFHNLPFCSKINYFSLICPMLLPHLSMQASFWYQWTKYN